MVVAVASVESFCNLLSRSKLLKPRDVQAVYRHWRAREARAPGEVDRFSKWLVHQHYLTGYHAQQLILGQADHFFLNHYRLLDLVGKGRMAGIFKGSHTLGHIVAIKVMPIAKSQDPQLLGRFRREAHMAVRLRHPNIVRTFHLGLAGKRHYLVMEYLEGETLEDTLKRRGKLPYPESVRLMHQAFQGLQNIHENGLVHRDLKPANFMLLPVRPPGAPDNTLNSTLKILDIGLGRVLFDEDMTTEAESFQLTTEGMMLGTPEYMSPEQAKDAHEVDIRTDIYSLGCVLYHLLTGQTPFLGKSPLKQIIGHAQETPRLLKEFDATIPDGLQTVVSMLMAKEPKKRYTTPAQAAKALQPFLPKQAQGPAEVSSLTKSYLQWVETQPIEEVNAVPPPAVRWVAAHRGQRLGPMPVYQLQQFASTGQIDPDDLIWMEGDDRTLAIAAKSVLDFTPAKNPAAAARPQAPKPAPAPAVSPYEEMGHNPETGQVFDAVKFRKWQQQQAEKKQREAAAAPSTTEAFQKARLHLDRWVDFDRNRRPIMAGDMDFVRQDPDIQRFMQHYARYGQDMVHKLWEHLQFMVENRRKYYYAFGG